MISQIKHTKKLFGGSFLKTVIIFLLVLVLVVMFNISNPIRSAASSVLSFFLAGGDYLYNNISQIPKNFSDKNKLIDENKNLSDKVEENKLRLIDYDSVKYENQELRKALKIKPAESFISAIIVARPPQIPMDSLFLNIGAEDGLSNGDLVLAGERILIGRIVAVYKSKSTVTLNSFADVIFQGFVARTNEPLEANGAGGGILEAKVPIDFDIVVGDKFMVPASSAYLAAVVGLIEEDNSSGFKSVLMSLPVNVSKTKVVFIEKNNND